ncbi:MAG: hypothetical protein WBA39_00110, partial [Rivularia sp. (in: cyanobacteria)]
MILIIIVAKFEQMFIGKVVLQKPLVVVENINYRFDTVALHYYSSFLLVLDKKSIRHLRKTFVWFQLFGKTASPLPPFPEQGRGKIKPLSLWGRGL